jgi:hypothetical protein
MTPYVKWEPSQEVVEVIDTIDFSYHSTVWDLIEIAFKAGYDAAKNEHE